MTLKFKTTLVIINYSETARLCWLKGNIERGEVQSMPPAARNVRETAARIARKAYRLHFARAVVPQITESNGVRFESQPGDVNGYHYHYAVGHHKVKIFHVSDDFTNNFVQVTLSSGSGLPSVVQFHTDITK
jgi:hypothetical protein